MFQQSQSITLLVERLEQTKHPNESFTSCDAEKNSLGDLHSADHHDRETV